MRGSSRPSFSPARVLGVRVTGGPFWQAALPIEPGLTVLYGKNGAGKSRLLDALHAGLSGRRARMSGDFLEPSVDVDVFVGGGVVPFEPAAKGDAHEFLNEWSFWHSDAPGAHQGPFENDLERLYLGILEQGLWVVNSRMPLPEGQSQWIPRLAAIPSASELTQLVFQREQELLGARETAMSGDGETLRLLRPLWEPHENTRKGMTDLEWVDDYISGATVFEIDRSPWPFRVGIPSDALPIPVGSDERQPTGLIVEGLRLLVEPSGVSGADAVTRTYADYLRDPESRYRTSAGWNLVDEDGLSLSGLLEWLSLLEAIAGEIYSRLLLEAPALELSRDGSRPRSWCVKGSPRDSRWGDARR